MSIKPAVKRSLLLFLSAMLWLIAGFILVQYAVRWLLEYSGWLALPLPLVGLLLGFVIWRWGFSRVVDRNIRRIEQLPEWPCLFAFQAWHSYLLIAVMISMGVVLRHAHFVPRLLLAIGYLGIGCALLFGCQRYMRAWIGKE